ncbi:MAG: MOSC domain-containing protein [Alteraurantiacibacter sp.]
MDEGAAPQVAALALSPRHGFSKQAAESITLIVGEGVAGDAHSGCTVKHRSRVRQDATQPNLRQVHLLPAELLAEMNALAFSIAPGDLGENVLTTGVDLMALPRGAQLRFPSGACVELTGLRNPCAQIEAFRPGLLAQVVGKSADGTIERRAGVMAIVLTGGAIAADDRMEVILPDLPHYSLEVV